jgi:hypothetical protein
VQRALAKSRASPCKNNALPVVESVMNDGPEAFINNSEPSMVPAAEQQAGGLLLQQAPNTVRDSIGLRNGGGKKGKFYLLHLFFMLPVQCR